MRISRIEAFGGNCPAVKPSMYVCPPFGPADGPARACSSDSSSSGSSESASRSFPWMVMLLALFSGLVSTCADEDCTTTFSCCTCRLIAMSSRSVCPTASATPGLSNIANPAATALTSYVPAANPLNSYIPSLFVVVSIELPDGVVSNTVAPTTAAPEGSVTSPRIRPFCVCAQLGIFVKSRSVSTNTLQLLHLFPVIVICTLKSRPFGCIASPRHCAAASPPLLRLQGDNMLDACSFVPASSSVSTPPNTVIAVGCPPFCAPVATIITASPF